MRKKKQQADAVGFGAGSQPAPRLTPMDVQQKEFRLAFRGYNERDVDAFLDLVTEELAAYIEENERLRRQAAPGTGPAASAQSASGDPADALGRAQAEAEEILRRAREQAAAIVREAELRASGAGGSRRSAIAPFLSREREFLTSLGRLVQDHAQAVREMVERARASDPAGPAPTADPAGSGDRPVRVELPEAHGVAGVGAAEPDPQAPGGEPRSLRELFWGED
ncbi:MAG TPA: DivIVA domain-containing protein [Actinomycetota bacterium]|nr:DivIVA domain-containing protein [Actinomycetota bacterium]